MPETFLFGQASCVRFGARGRTLAQLSDYLKAQQPPLPAVLQKPESLMLRELQTPLQTQAGWGFSQAAFQQLCRTLAPGLQTLFLDLYRQPELSAKQLAVQLFNDVLKQQFKAKLLGKKLLTSRNPSLICGFLPPQQRYMPLAVFESNGRKLLKRHAPTAQLTSAVCEQLQLLLCFVEPTRYEFAPARGAAHVYQLGWMLQYDALENQIGLYGGLFLEGRFVCPRLLMSNAPTKRGWPRSVVAAAMRMREDWATQAAELQTLWETPLGFQQDRAANAKLLRELAVWLSGKSKPADFYKKVVYKLSMYDVFESNRTAPVSAHEVSHLVHQSLYELFARCLLESDKGCLSTQQRLMNVAAWLLQSKQRPVGLFHK